MVYRSLSRRLFLRLSALVGGTALIAACAPQVVKETVLVEKEVEKIVKETVVVEGEVKEKEVVKEVVVTATPPPKPALQAVTLDWWNPPLSEAALNKAAEIMDQPQIKFQVVNFADYLNKLKVAFAAGSGPDMFRMNVPSGKFWMAKGIHLSLQPWIDANPEYAKAVESFVPATITSYSLRNELMGVPIGAETSLGYFNRDWFDKEGITPPDEQDWTWDTQLETMQKLTKGEGADQVYGTMVNAHTQSGLQEFIYATGGRIIADDGLSAACGSPETIEGMKWAVDLVQKYKVSPEATAWTQSSGFNYWSAWWNWKIAYVATGEWGWWILRDQQLADKKFKIGFVEPPKHPTTGLRGAQNHTICMAIYSKTRYPQEAGALLMPFLTKEVQELIPPEFLPARTDAQDGFYKGEGAEEIRPVIEATQEYSVPYPATSLDEATVGLFWQAAQQMLAGTLPVEEGCQQVEKEINDTLQRAAAGM